MSILSPIFARSDTLENVRSYTPLAQALREAIDRSPLSFEDVASRLGVGRTGLSERLGRKGTLDLDRPSHQEYARRVCEAIEADWHAVMLRAEQLKRELATGHPEPPLTIDHDIATVLIETLYATTSPPKARDRARVTLYRMLGIEPPED